MAKSICANCKFVLKKEIELNTEDDLLNFLREEETWECEKKAETHQNYVTEKTLIVNQNANEKNEKGDCADFESSGAIGDF